MRTIILKSEDEIKLMYRAGQIVADVFTAVKPLMREGVSTLEIDREVNRVITGQGARPCFLNYGEPPFPGSACVSINEEVVHGIPSAERILRKGDIVSVDVGAELNGYNGDACRTFVVGETAPEIQKLVDVTEESFWKGLEQAYIGKRIGDISHAVQAHCEAHGFGVIRELTGHGIGRDLHEEPNLLNYGRPGRGPRLEVGMCLCLEPMITLGDYDIAILDDEWTIVTSDGLAASHYENTFAITADGPKCLTLTPAEAEEHREFAYDA